MMEGLNSSGSKRKPAEALHARSDDAISEEEAAIYDRQIRLWGLDAQKRMRSAKVLLACLGGIQTEVCKNLVLAGVGSVTIYDDVNTSLSDLSAQFFLEESDVGKKRAEAAMAKITSLNPKVEVQYEFVNISTKDEAELKAFDVICVSNCTQTTLIKLDHICRKFGIPFYATDSFGYKAYIFSDLDGHRYTPDETKDPKKDKETQGEPAKKKHRTEDGEGESEPELLQITSPSLEDVLTRVKWSQPSLRKVSKLFFSLPILWAWKETHGQYPLQGEKVDAAEERALIAQKNAALTKHGLKTDFVSDEVIINLARSANADLSPVCAIVGGILGQQIIKVLTAKDEPFQNFFIYDALTASGNVDDIKPT